MKFHKWYHPLLYLGENSKLFRRASSGVWDHIIWEASLCPCETQRLSPWPQKKGEKEAFLAILLCGFLKPSSTFASLGTRALEKRLIKLHKEPRGLLERKGLRLPSPFHEIQRWEYAGHGRHEGILKRKSHQEAAKSQNLSRTWPPLTSTTTTWVPHQPVSFGLSPFNCSPYSTHGHQHSVCRTTAEFCFYNSVTSGHFPAQLSPISSLSLREKALRGA